MQKPHTQFEIDNDNAVKKPLTPAQKAGHDIVANELDEMSIEERLTGTTEGPDFSHQIENLTLEGLDAQAKARLQQPTESRPYPHQKER